MDKSRFAKVYGMRTKDALPEAFREFVRDMRTMGDGTHFRGTQKYTLQADSGTEYRSKNFLDLCSNHSVRVRTSRLTRRARMAWLRDGSDQQRRLYAPS